MWHIRRFHDEFQKITCVRPDVTVVGDQYIVCLLCKIFRYWDDKEERKAVDSLIYMEASFISTLSAKKVCCIHFLLCTYLIAITVYGFQEKKYITIFFSNAICLHVVYSTEVVLNKYNTT